MVLDVVKMRYFLHEQAAMILKLSEFFFFLSTWYTVYFHHKAATTTDKMTSLVVVLLQAKSEKTKYSYSDPNSFPN